MTHTARIALAMAAAVGLALAYRPATAQDKGKGKSKHDDTAFIQKTASAGIHEVKLGEIANDRAMDPEVKQFATRMVTDHTKANRELKAVAEQMGVQVPDKMMQEHQEHVDKLSLLKGREFDRAYIAHMVDDHKTAVDAFKKCSQSANDERLKTFATRTLPTVQEHLTMAEQIQARMKR